MWQHQGEQKEKTAHFRLPYVAQKRLCLSSLLTHDSLTHLTHLIAELQRAKRASEAPWVRKVGNPSSWENLVMTSAYDRASERANVRTDSGEGEGRLEIFLTVTHMGNSFLGGFLFRKVRKTLISVCHVNKRSEWLIYRFKVGFNSEV